MSGTAPAGPITVIECDDCATDSRNFDEFVTGAYDVIVGRTTVDVAILDNKTVSPGPSVGFGAAIDVDGDWAVVVPPDASTIDVLRRVDGAGWEIEQSFSSGGALNGSSVAIGSDHFAVGSSSGLNVYRRSSAADPFVSIDFSEGAVLDLAIDGDKLVVGSSGDGDRVVEVLQLSSDLELMSPPALLGTIDRSFDLGLAGFGDSVAVDDRGNGSLTVLVGARQTDDEGPDVGVVYVYEVAADGWGTNPTPLVALEAPDFDAEFGSSLGVSDGMVVVGDPFNDNPLSDEGVVWVYDESGSSPQHRPS